MPTPRPRPHRQHAPGGGAPAYPDPGPGDAAAGHPGSGPGPGSAAAGHPGPGPGPGSAAAGHPEFRAHNPRLEIPDISPFGQAERGARAWGRGVIVEGSPFHVNSAAYKLSN